MASKRCAGSILEYFTKKVKSTTTSVSTEGIALTDLTDLSTSSGDEALEAPFVTQTTPLVNPLHLSNTNNLLKNNDESENRPEIFDNPDKSPNENNQTSLTQTTNLSTSNLSTQSVILMSKCDLYCCNSSTPYHPVRDDELVLTTIDKRSCQKQWFLDYTWLTFCKVSFRVKQIQSKSKFIYRI
ncbi:unnamed protein product [Rotaria sp. Silwood2]|nr:unnamed protein product [Rotaria sp. Silwood2]CAF4313045.1 unnamed protein product [Rotaria sp. Silwood2]